MTSKHIVYIQREVVRIFILESAISNIRTIVAHRARLAGPFGRANPALPAPGVPVLLDTSDTEPSSSLKNLGPSSLGSLVSSLRAARRPGGRSDLAVLNTDAAPAEYNIRCLMGDEDGHA